MPRRRDYFLTLRCPTPGCTEQPTVYGYTTQRDYRDAVKRYGHTFACLRHRKPGEVLDPADNPRTSITYVSVGLTRYSTVDKKHYPIGLFWVTEQELATSDDPTGSGSLYGPGFKAWAKDFPEGTRITVTAEATLPEVLPGVEEDTPLTAAGGTGESTPAVPAAHHPVRPDQFF
jgi:hypothetical protein